MFIKPAILVNYTQGILPKNTNETLASRVLVLILAVWLQCKLNGNMKGKERDQSCAPAVYLKVVLETVVVFTTTQIMHCHWAPVAWGPLLATISHYTKY